MVAMLFVSRRRSLALSGSFDVLLDDGNAQEIVRLNRTIMACLCQNCFGDGCKVPKRLACICYYIM